MYFLQTLANFVACSFPVKNEINIKKNYVLLSICQTYVLVIINTKLKSLVLNCMRLETDVSHQLNHHYRIGQTR